MYRELPRDRQSLNGSPGWPPTQAKRFRELEGEVRVTQGDVSANQAHCASSIESLRKHTDERSDHLVGLCTRPFHILPWVAVLRGTYGGTGGPCGRSGHFRQRAVRGAQG